MQSERMRSWIRKFELSSTVIYSRCRMPTARQRNQCPIRGNLASAMIVSMPRVSNPYSKLLGSPEVPQTAARANSGRI